MVLALVMSVAVSGVAHADPSASDWQRLRQCESGDNYSINTGNGYYGAYQFDLSTWRSVGGTGYPHQASPATQDALALKLWQARGWSPWACASIIGLTSSPPSPPTPPKPAPPVGYVDNVSVNGTTATVAGWTLDPGSPGTSIAVHLYVNNAGFAYIANKPRPDVNAAMRVTGQHGFSETVQLAPGPNTICAFGIGTAANNNTLLFCGVYQGPARPVGVVDAMAVSALTTTVSGWAFDPNSPGASIAVHVYVGNAGTATLANNPRPDVNAVMGVSGQHGFSVNVPLQRGPNTVCAYSIGVASGNNALIQCQNVIGPVPPIGVVDAMTVSGTTAFVGGWALDQNSGGSSIAVHMYVNGVGYAFSANKPRPDVDAVYGVSGQHGFSESVPLRPGSNSICVFAIGVGTNNNTLLQCRDLQLNSPQRLAAAAPAPDAAAAPAPDAAVAPAVEPTPSSAAAVAPSTTAAAPATTGASSPATSAPATSAPPAGAPKAATSPVKPSTTTQAPTAGAPAPGAAAPLTATSSMPAAAPQGSSRAVSTTPTARPSATGGLESAAVTGRTGTLTGWIADAGATSAGVPVRVSVNGVMHEVIAASVRADLPTAGGAPAPLGFTDTISLIPGSNEICLYQGERTGGAETAPIACRTEMIK